MPLIDSYPDLDPRIRYRLILFENSEDDPMTALVMLDQVFKAFEERSEKMPDELNRELKGRRSVLREKFQKILQEKRASLKDIKKRIKPEPAYRHTSRTHEIFGD